MKKAVTLVDIAERCGTSNVTVSKALAGKEGVSAELREKIKKVAAELGYTVSKGAAAKKNRNIGVLIPEKFINPNGSFYWALYNSLVKDFKRKNFYCIMEILTQEDEEKLVLPRMISEKKICGLVSLGQTDAAYAKKLAANTDCMILLDYYVAGLELDCVLTNGYSGAYKITNHLIEMGHTEIGYIGSLFATSSILDRYMGYCKSMLEHGLEVKKEWTIADRDDKGLFIEMDFPEKLPTAFVCNCDEAAFHAIKQLKVKGYEIPNDISIVGYDNYLISEISDPTITTVAIEADVMAAETVELVERRLDHPNYLPYVKNMEGTVCLKESVKKLK